MLEIVRTYLKDRTLANPGQFVEALGVCGSLLGFWTINGVSGRHVRSFQSRAVRAKAYREFDVPKKSGGVRHISAPVAPLKEIQQALNLLLQALCEVSPSATGFVPGRSVLTNATMHLGQGVVFNCDLKNFFPGISKQMVRAALKEHLWHRIPSAAVINMICSLATVPDESGRESLPQGAPTSPVLSNIVMIDIDRRLEGFARANGYRYSRYADDITFSHSHAEATMRPDKIAAIFAIIEEYGLVVNPAKTKIATSAVRREVTGLTVGSKVNVPRSYIKQLRTLLHLWESRGLSEAQLIYTRDFCNGVETNLVSVINGKINYLAMVKGRTDSTYRRFKFRYRRLIRRQKEKESATGRNTEG